MASATDAPAPLRLPAILQNASNAAQRQVEAHNAQQRERIAARRDAKGRSDASAGSGRGKRVVRRIDNAAFTDNPHIVAPRRTDLYPSVPLQPRPSRASFPPQALDRSAQIPNAAAPDRDPFSESSTNGAFTTSLKGTRALLRKRGHRAEGLVGRVEEVVRGWLGGDWEMIKASRSHSDEDGEVGPSWKVIDDLMVDLAPTTTAQSEGRNGEAAGLSMQNDAASTGTSPNSSWRLPAQHRVYGALPPLPISQEPGGPARVPAVLELSRSLAHLTLAAVDPFDRLVVHLIARYYECISWSESHLTSSGQSIRLTHLVVPSIANPRASAAHKLFTPETTDVSDLSGLSGSDSERSASSNNMDSDTDTETEKGTEIDPDETYTADDEHVQGYIVDPAITASEHQRLAAGLSRLELGGHADIGGAGLSLARTHSAGSSMYASSEADSEYSSLGGLGDSLTLPPAPSQGQMPFGWRSEARDDMSDAGSVVVPMVMPRAGQGRDAQGGRIRRSAAGWSNKPTFFEYLYGE